MPFRDPVYEDALDEKPQKLNMAFCRMIIFKQDRQCNLIEKLIWSFWNIGEMKL